MAVHNDSKYIDADFSDGVYISQAYADKFLLKPGDTITLKEKYEDDEYTLQDRRESMITTAGSVSLCRRKN